MDGRGEDHHVEALVAQALGFRVLVPDAQPAILGPDRAGPSPDEPGAFCPCALQKPVEALPVSPEVHVEDRHVLDAVVHELEGVLHRVHAAEPGAVPVQAPVPRADAENQEHPLGVAAVRGADDLPPGGTGGGEQALQLDGRQDIGVAPIAVLPEAERIHQVVAHRHDDGTDFPLHPPHSRHPEVDALGAAGLDAVLAGQVVRGIVQAVLDVQHVGTRHRLGDRRVDGLPRGHGGVELVGENHRAGGHALAAARALVAHEAGPLPDPYPEATRLPRHRLHLGEGEDLDAGVLPHLGHLGRLDADRAIQGGEVLVEDRHLAADAGGPLHQEDPGAGVGQVQRSLDARDPPADHQHRVAHHAASRLSSA